jgi:hypothetical protein
MNANATRDNHAGFYAQARTFGRAAVIYAFFFEGGVVKVGKSTNLEARARDYILHGVNGLDGFVAVRCKEEFLDAAEDMAHAIFAGLYEQGRGTETFRSDADGHDGERYQELLKQSVRRCGAALDTDRLAELEARCAALDAVWALARDKMPRLATWTSVANESERLKQVLMVADTMLECSDAAREREEKTQDEHEAELKELQGTLDEARENVEWLEGVALSEYGELTRLQRENEKLRTDLATETALHKHANDKLCGVMVENFLLNERTK